MNRKIPYESGGFFIMRILFVCSISCFNECFEYLIKTLLILLMSDSDKILFSDILLFSEFVLITISLGQ